MAPEEAARPEIQNRECVLNRHAKRDSVMSATPVSCSGNQGDRTEC